MRDQTSCLRVEVEGGQVWETRKVFRRCFVYGVVKGRGRQVPNTRGVNSSQGPGARHKQRATRMEQ